jgi:hypothetical protein
VTLFANLAWTLRTRAISNRILAARVLTRLAGELLDKDARRASVDGVAAGHRVTTFSASAG